METLVRENRSNDAVSSTRKKRTKQKRRRVKQNSPSAKESSSASDVVGKKSKESDYFSITSHTLLPPIESTASYTCNIYNMNNIHNTSKNFSQGSTTDKVSKPYENTLSKSMRNLKVRKVSNFAAIREIKGVNATRQTSAYQSNISKTPQSKNSNDETNNNKKNDNIDTKLCEDGVQSTNTQRWEKQNIEQNNIKFDLEQYKADRRQRYYNDAKRRGLSWGRVGHQLLSNSVITSDIPYVSSSEQDCTSCNENGVEMLHVSPVVKLNGININNLAQSVM